MPLDDEIEVVRGIDIRVEVVRVKDQSGREGGYILFACNPARKMLIISS